MNANELLEAYVDDVVRHLERKHRNDVGVELRALLTDELRAQAATAGRPADLAMATDLLRRFGRPADVAARYRAPGFPVIDASDAASFVRISAIGMAAIWILGFFVTFRVGGGTNQLVRWWFAYGLAAFWWPGFLVVCWGVAAWVKRRFPLADEWKPRSLDRDRIYRPGWVLAIAWFTLGTIWLLSPAQFIEQLTGGRLPREFYSSLVYDETFRHSRLPLLLTLLAAHLALYVVLVAHGRWRRPTRRLDIALSTAITALLFWSIASGRIFASDAGDGVARFAIGLILLFVIWDIAVKLYRELVRVRMPTALA